MSESELRKIVNDGYNKFKAFENGKDALDALDALKQAEGDFSRTIKSLESKKGALSKEVTELELAKKDAVAKAEITLNDAKQKADAIIQAAMDKAAELQEKAEQRVAAISKTIEEKGELAVEYAKKAKEAKANLDDIQSQIDETAAKFRAMSGK